MASKLSNSSALRAVARSYSAQAATQASAAASVQVSKLPSGAVVASVENNSPLARVAVFVKGGSRYDTVPGVSNMLRLAGSAGLSSVSRTGFNLKRTEQQIGATLDVDSDQEVAVYSIATNRDSVGESLSILATLSSNNTYRYYELPSPVLTARLKATLELPPCAQTVDLLGKAAFRGQSLGNSIYVPNYNIGKISAEQLNAFVSGTHGSSGVVVVGSGVDHDVLVSGAEAMGISDGGVAASAAAQYCGGDVRREMGGAMAHVAVAGQGAKLGSGDMVAALVAAQLLAGGAGVKYGVNSSSVLPRSIKGSGRVQALNMNFSDSGLLGFYLSAPAAQAPQLVADLTAAAKNLTASDKDVAGAKARVRNALLGNNSGCREVQSLGRQLLLTGNAVDAVEAAKAVDAVTPAAVTKVIAKAFGGKLSVAAVGNVNQVPYSDTL